MLGRFQRTRDVAGGDDADNLARIRIRHPGAVYVCSPTPHVFAQLEALTSELNAYVLPVVHHGGVIQTSYYW